MRMTSELEYESRLVAQQRWRLLARALTRSPEPEPQRELDDVEPITGRISVRRFGSFGLLRADQLPEPAHRGWWLYSCLIASELYQLLVRRIDNCFTADQLIGFNNTGNVCVWPSEECLAYYLLTNGEMCRGRRVLELGGGMSCLAGVLAAKYCGASSVTLTDGNARSVENVSRIVERNGLEGVARCAVVQWARAAEALNKSSRATQEPNDSALGLSEAEGYDVILCADCLFFDEARLDLVDTIYGWLADDGLALVMAPRRGATFRSFAEAALRRGLVVRQCERYDAEVWSRHLHLLANNLHYCPDIHFPVLLQLTKPNHQPP